MIYTVGEMAQRLGVPAYTPRYYDKEGLLPFVERSSGISERCSPSRSSSYSTRWRPWSISAGSTRLPKPPGQWMSPVR